MRIYRYILVVGLLLSLNAPVCWAADNKAVTKDQEKRIERATKGINDILDKEKCALDPQFILTLQGNSVQIRIVPLEKDKNPEKK